MQLGTIGRFNQQMRLGIDTPRLTIRIDSGIMVVGCCVLSRGII